MASSNLTLLLHWLDYTVQLAPKVCMVVVAAFVCIRLRWVRGALRGAETSWFHRFMMMLAFGGLAILATHSGIVITIGQGVKVSEWPATGLRENQALVGFRDTMVLASGLIGGPWVGLGAGFISGLERHSLGGFAALASGLATLMLGGFAGWARRRRPRGATTPEGAFIVALFGTVLHRLFIMFSPEPHNWAMVLSLNIFIPVALVNSLGCVLFIWVMRDLDRDSLEIEVREAQLLKQQAELREQQALSLKEKAELRALRAQVEPHFLNNTLNAIRSLIRRDPGLAREYVFKLAAFFETTRRFSTANTITLRQELEQLDRYLDFQHLRFGEKFQYGLTHIPATLLDCQLPPHCLLTLAENALAHGRGGRAKGFALQVFAEDLGDRYQLRVIDNGKGIAPERLAKLGKAPVESSRGNGTALHQLSKSLELAFSGLASLAIASQLGHGTEVTLTLPKEH
jgi:LytS/YehU family sensor histidine kinase